MLKMLENVDKTAKGYSEYNQENFQENRGKMAGNPCRTSDKTP